ncbi:ABC transporter ATP-binding protein [Svornostia abyssi]|uniref:ABC transporter ATP-binding protein n=1 Tax=Svornostia abyssi TaxID=2898438 RepID=A0ABY5PG75_9ACTN|nr:ABC transporter ATP-binding protein [Parviterribacteraceae bacterium J379]
MPEDPRDPNEKLPAWPPSWAMSDTPQTPSGPAEEPAAAEPEPAAEPAPWAEPAAAEPAAAPEPEAAPEAEPAWAPEWTTPEPEPVAYANEPETVPTHEAPTSQYEAVPPAAAAAAAASSAEPPAAEPPVEAPRVSVVNEPEGHADEEYRYHDSPKRSAGVPNAIEFVDVHKAFGRNEILKGLNMGIPEDKISMILGPSGTGKSVCIKHMVGLLYPDQGDVIVHGESVPNMTDDELFDMRKRFGVLFQDGALFGSMNLEDNVAFPLRQHTDKGEEEIREIVQRRLAEVGLSGSWDKMPNELSGGMRKRAGFARALVLDPDIVLFDEPDSGLDPVRTALLCELIEEIHQENGGAYVVITHDILSAKRVAEHISVLWRGRIVESGPAEELFNSDNPFVRQFLSGESQGPLGME